MTLIRVMCGHSVEVGQSFVQGSSALRRRDGVLLKRMTVEHAAISERESEKRFL